MCTATHPAHPAAATSQSDEETSLTSVAPASSAAAATAGFSVSIETRTRPASASITGMTRASSTASGTGSAPGRRRLAPHIDDVGPCGHHVQPVGHGGLGGEVAAPVRERVRRHVENAHDERTVQSGVAHRRSA